MEKRRRKPSGKKYKGESDDEEEETEEEGTFMKRCRFGGMVVYSAGYDAQCAVLEIEFTGDGEIWQYLGVSEEIWYCFKQGDAPDSYFQKFIKGHFPEGRVLPDGSRKA